MAERHSQKLGIFGAHAHAEPKSRRGKGRFNAVLQLAGQRSFALNISSKRWSDPPDSSSNRSSDPPQRSSQLCAIDTPTFAAKARLIALGSLSAGPGELPF